MMKWGVTVVLMTLLSVGSAVADWPQVNGPHGNFNPRKYGHRLVDDLSRARVVWVSEDSDLGYGKTSVSGFTSNRAKWPGHPGSCGGLIAAGGRIFAASFRPAGEAWAETSHAAKAMPKYTPQQQAKLRSSLRIEADDIVVAIDMATGKTAWKAVEERKGLHRGMGKRGGWGVTPAYCDGPSTGGSGQGKVFSLGTTGRLYAYDAATGKKVWETHIGKTHLAWEAEKKRHLEKRSLPSSGQLASLTVADGVLIVPLFDGALDISLRGVDVETGKTLWEVPAATAKKATPALWRHRGRQYVLAATYGKHQKTGTGKLHLIDPKSGKVLWAAGGLANTHFALAPSERHVLVNVGSKTVGHGGLPWMRLAAYRLSLTGAKRVWAMPDEPGAWHEAKYEASDWRKYLIRDGRVYYYSRCRKPDKSMIYEFFIFEEATGEILYRRRDDTGRSGKTITRGQLYLVEDRILQVPDASHGSRLSLQLWTADPKDFRPLGRPWSPPHTGTTAYEVFMEFPYVDGRIFMRAQDGTVRCYDLRKEK